ncbi:hypothetical protein [Maridesulfovibrio sp.]|uniref:hypothetical protein n=1 Tax=Maridesulfovibrio sp. TaxID=2795000 RepID=UPI0029F5B3D2|nr:hypothetical protein [Maridesulfovibrio sp.]
MITARFEITNRCNLKCPSCYSGRANYLNQHPVFKYASLELCEKIYKKLKSFDKNIEMKLYQLNEPLLHPDLNGVLDLNDKYDLPCCISSNIIIKKDWVQLLAHKSLRRFIISTSGCFSNSYPLGHRGGDTALFLKHLNELALAAKTSSTEIEVIFHQYNDNEKDEKYLSSFCYENGFTFTPIPAFIMYSPWDNACKYRGKEKEQLDIATNVIPRIILQKNFLIENIPGLGMLPCMNESKNDIAIDTEGYVQHNCCMVPFSEEHRAGHILDLSFEETQQIQKKLSICLDCKKKGYHMQYGLIPHIEYTYLARTRASSHSEVNINESIRSFLRSPLPPKKIQNTPIYVYGLIGGERIIRLLQAKGCIVAGIIDDNPRLTGVECEGYPVLNMEQASSTDSFRKGTVIICFIRSPEQIKVIKNNLLEKGVAQALSLYELFVSAKDDRVTQQA